MSLSDISDLTDLSSGEDDIPLAKRTSNAKKKLSREYKISHVLRAPRTAQYTAKSLYDQIIDNSIDLDPEYQRDVVWQEEKQSGLIDSVLRNYYIPPIIFAVTVQDDGSELRTCIDGKQRLTSIQRFIDGQIPHKDSFTNERLWFKSSATNAKRKLLPQHLRTLFANKQIVCVEYTGLDGDQEREIFQRVQLGVALTPAERLQALVGPWSTVIREIQNQVLGEEGFEGYLDWGHARGRDFQCLATIGYLIENHPKTTVPGIKTLEKWLQKTQVVSNQLRADLHETFRIFVTLARDKKYSGSLNRPTRVSPVEFVMIGVLIYLKRQTLSLTQISSAIEKMRKDVRASHQDIRSNTRVTKHLMEFMAKKIKVSELKSDGEGDRPAAQVIAKAVKPAKRKRPSYSDESDLEPIVKVKSAKSSIMVTPVEAVKSSKQKGATREQKMNGTKKTAPPSPLLKAGLSGKPSTLRTTNNSLSNLLSVTVEKSPLPTPTTNAPHDSTPPPPQPISNGHNVYSEPTASYSGSRAPLAVETSSTIKAESPQLSSLSSPATLSVIDRLAPIRAAKASLASAAGTQPTSASQDNGSKPTLGLGTNTRTPVDLQQNPIVPQPARHQATLLLPQRPPPPPQTQTLSGNPAQGRRLPVQVEGVLQALHAQFPQLCAPTQSLSSNAVSPAAASQGMQPNGTTGHSTTPLSIPNPIHHGSVNDSPYVSQGYGVPPQGPRSGTFMNAYPNPNQALGPYAAPPRSPSNFGASRNVTPQQPAMNFSVPTSAGLHSLSQRPVAAANLPSRSTRAEPLGPAPRSTSLESATQDGRRGSHTIDRHRPSSERRPSRFSSNEDIDRDRRNWSRPRF